ncbi:MAG: hypothetical protein WC022_02190 [Parcubacteria group bacterium]
MDIKKHCQKIFVFIVNMLLVVLIVLGIKENAKNNLATEIAQSDTTTPLDKNILQSQSDIATDRENKLRSLNNSPKSITQSSRTTTTVQPPAPTTSSAATPSRKTKTS